MVSPFVVHKDAKDIGPYYAVSKYIISLWTKVEFSSLEDEEMLIVDTCSSSKMVTMFVYSNPYFLIFTSIFPSSRI